MGNKLKKRQKRLEIRKAVYKKNPTSIKGHEHHSPGSTKHGKN